MTHRIESKIEPFFSTWLKENVSFFSLIQRIFLFDTMYDSENKLIVSGKYDSKNWTSKKKKRKELNFSFLEHDAQNWTTLVLNMTRRIELFSSWMRLAQLNLFPIWLKELNPFSWIWLKELNFFLKVTQRTELFSQSDSKNCFFFFLFSVWLEELNPLFWIYHNELNPFVDWLKELNPVFSIWLKDLTLLKKKKKDFQELSLFENMNQRIELLKVWLKALHSLFSIWVNESNTLFQYESKNWIFLNMTHRNFSKL